MDFTKETYDKIRREMKFRHLAQEVLERVNEIYKNPNYKHASWAVYGGAGKKVLKKE